MAGYGSVRGSSLWMVVVVLVRLGDVGSGRVGSFGGRGGVCLLNGGGELWVVVVLGSVRGVGFGGMELGGSCAWIG